MAVVGRRRPRSVSASRARPSWRRVERGERAIRPRERLLDVRLGVAHELREERQGARGEVRDRGRSAARRGSSWRSSSRRGGAPSATGCRRAARARPSGTAPARCPVPYGCASESTVIQSPASRAARRSSCHVRSGSAASVRSSSPNANQRVSSSFSRNRRSARNSSVVARSCRVACAKAALDGREQRPANAEDRPRCRARRGVGPRGTRDRRAPPRPAPERRREAVGVVDELGQRACPRLRRGSRRSATSATARAVVDAGRRGGHHRAASSDARSSRRKP